MKKELKKHISSNAVETDIRKLTRNVFRKEHIDLVLSKDGESDVKAEQVQVTPQFAAIAERILGENKSKVEHLKALMNMTEIWQPPTPSSPKKKRKTRKPRKKLDVTFKPGKMFKDLGLEIEFIPDMYE